MRPIVFLFLFLTLCMSCSRQAEKSRIKDLEVAEEYNYIFYSNTNRLYSTVDKMRITQKAMGQSLTDFSVYYPIKDLCKDLYDEVYLYKYELVRAKAPNWRWEQQDFLKSDVELNERRIVRWAVNDFVIEVVDIIDSVFNMVKNDSIHQYFANNTDVDYNRDFTISTLKSDLNQLKKSLITTSENSIEIMYIFDAIEFLNLSVATVLLAERKAIRFLHEHYFAYNEDVYDGGLQYQTHDLSVYKSEKQLKISTIPIYRSCKNLYLNVFTINGPGFIDSITVKGKLHNQIDTIWIPTDEVGTYSINGSKKSVYEPSREFPYSFKYKVIEE